jgi:hypothetical protein
MAMNCGFEDYAKVRSDKNLANLRASPKFEPLLEKYDEPGEGGKQGSTAMVRECRFSRRCSGSCCWRRTSSQVRPISTGIHPHALLYSKCVYICSALNLSVAACLHTPLCRAAAE